MPAYHIPCRIFFSLCQHFKPLKILIDLLHRVCCKERRESIVRIVSTDIEVIGQHEG